MCGLWGGVNPRFSDDLFEFLFPAGYQGIMWTPVILGFFIGWYLLGTWALRHYTTQDHRTWGNIGWEIVVAIGLGIFTMPVTIAIGLCLGAKTAAYVKIVLNSHSEGPERVVPSRWKRVLLRCVRAFSILLFIVTPVGGFVLIMIMRFVDIAWCLVIGAATAIVIIAVRKIARLPNFMQSPTLSRQNKRLIKSFGILLPVIFGVSVLWETLGKTFLPIPAPSSTPTTLKIVTYNIRLGVATEDNPANNWINRRDDIVAYIDDLGADIIDVQEAYLFQLQYILAGMESAPFQFTGLGRDNGVHGGEHEAILFNTEKFRLVDGDTFWLSNCTLVPSKEWDPSNYRVCTWARFEVIATGAQFCVFNTHYGFGDIFNASASSLICDRIKTHSGSLPTFATGDFNMDNLSRGYAVFESYPDKPMKDAYRLCHGDDHAGDTSTNDWTNPSSSSRIDFVFCSSSITVTSASIPQNHRSNGQTYSDHYPVVVDCSF